MSIWAYSYNNCWYILKFKKDFKWIFVLSPTFLNIFFGFQLQRLAWHFVHFSKHGYCALQSDVFLQEFCDPKLRATVGNHKNRNLMHQRITSQPTDYLWRRFNLHKVDLWETIVIINGHPLNVFLMFKYIQLHNLLSSSRYCLQLHRFSDKIARYPATRLFAIPGWQ